MRRVKAGDCHRAWVGILSLILATGLWPVGSTRDARAQERVRLTVGLAAQSVNVLVLHVAAERTAASEGLDLQLVSLGGGSRVMAAVVSGSVDLGVVGLNTLTDAITAGHGVKAYYNLAGHAEFEWFGRPGVSRWADVRSVAVTSRGSLTEALTLHVLRKHGVKPAEVQIVAAGEVASLLGALRAGRADAGILVAPFTWQAAAVGLVQLGTEEREFGPGWPRNLVVSREALVAAKEPLVRAFLRAYVRAVRLIRTDPEAGIRTAVERLKYERSHAERAYGDLLRGLDERGDLPRSGLDSFWEIAQASGWVPGPWPDVRYLDRRFIDTMGEWAP